MTEPNAASREARAREQCAAMLDSWATAEDFAIKVSDEPADKARCAVVAAEFRRAAKAIRALADEAASQPREDTVAFVRHWMMSGDYPVDPWTLEFAAAIDARTAPTDQAQAGEVERVQRALAELDGKEWSEHRRALHVAASLAQSGDPS